MESELLMNTDKKLFTKIRTNSEMNDHQNFAFPSRWVLLLTVSAPHFSCFTLPPLRRRATLLNFTTPLKTKDTAFEENFASEQSMFRASGFAGNNVNQILLLKTQLKLFEHLSPAQSLLRG